MVHGGQRFNCFDDLPWPTCDLMLFWMAVQALCIVLFDKGGKNILQMFPSWKNAFVFLFYVRG